MFAGDMFARAGEFEEKKDEFALDVMQRMGYDAVALGELDFVHGLDFLQTQLKKYPFFVCANAIWSDTGKPLANPVLYRTYRLQAAPNRPARAVTVAIFGLLTPVLQTNIDTYLKDSPNRVRVLDPAAEAKKIVKAAREKAQLVVALTHMDDQPAKDLASQVPGIDVMVLGHGVIRKITEPLKVNSTLLVGESGEGKYVGQLTLMLDSKGKIEASAGMSVAMDEAIPDEPEIARMLKELNATQVKPAGVGQFNPPPPPTFVGAIGCKGCHKPQYDQWRQTRHASAFVTLGLKDKANASKPECLACHTLGFGQPGGFVNMQSTPSLANVQCENCHGQGGVHASAPPQIKKGSILRLAGAAGCQNCHDRKNDPTFDYAQKLPLIKH